MMILNDLLTFEYFFARSGRNFSLAADGMRMISLQLLTIIIVLRRGMLIGVIDTAAGAYYVCE